MTQRVALVRAPSSRLADGLVTHLERTAVDPALAAEQHARYVEALAGAGWTIREAPAADELPDSAFIEDTLVVCGDVAVLARPGAAARRPEVVGAEQAVRGLGLDLERIEAPGTLDGGDVLQVGRHRVRRPRRPDERRGHSAASRPPPRTRTVVPVPLREVLHLKSAVTALPDGTIVCADRSLLDTSPLPPRARRPRGGRRARRAARRRAAC